MEYNDARSLIKTGDPALVEGKKPFSWAIRVNLGQQFSHIALFFWRNGGLWVAEMLEGVGYKQTPASQWILMQSGPVFWGKAPSVVSDNQEKIVAWIDNYRANPSNLEYGGIPTLIKVLMGHWFGIAETAKKQVCSTFVQEAWLEAGGYKCSETLLSPGDFVNYCQSLTPIK